MLEFRVVSAGGSVSTFRQGFLPGGNVRLHVPKAAITEVALLNRTSVLVELNLRCWVRNPPPPSYRGCSACSSVHPVPPRQQISLTVPESDRLLLSVQRTRHGRTDTMGLEFS